MVRRWIIRSLALMLLTLCVTAWVGSYWREIVAYEKSQSFQRGGFFAGRLCLLSCDAGQIIWSDKTLYEFAVYNWDIQANYHILGFHFVHCKFPEWTEIIIPLWFPTLLSALLLWFVWWKTKPRKMRQGFPIEPTAKPTAAEHNGKPLPK
jgi:hypothetical protein